MILSNEKDVATVNAPQDIEVTPGIVSDTPQRPQHIFPTAGPQSSTYRRLRAKAKKRLIYRYNDRILADRTRTRRR